MLQWFLSIFGLEWVWRRGAVMMMDRWHTEPVSIAEPPLPPLCDDNCCCYMTTILNRRRWMRLIRKGLKTCEIKSRRVVLPPGCKYLLFRGSVREVLSKGCRHFLVARLLTTTPLGPFRSGAEVLKASAVAGQEFKTGMSERELDRFIASKKSKAAWVYRFEEVRVCQDGAIEWSDRKNSGNCGFLSAYDKKRECVRFRVRRGYDDALVEPDSGTERRCYGDVSE
jgi:hypothetical protein